MNNTFFLLHQYLLAKMTRNLTEDVATTKNPDTMDSTPELNLTTQLTPLTVSVLKGVNNLPLDNQTFESLLILFIFHLYHKANNMVVIESF